MSNGLCRHALSFGLSLALVLAFGVRQASLAAKEPPHRTELQQAIDIIGPMNRA
ncbi:hypothetical protein [Adonisia turfae]